MGMSGVERLSELTFPERVLVAAARHWVRFAAAGDEPQTAIDEVFVRAGAPEAARGLDRLLSLLVCYARAPLRLHDLHGVALTRDEIRLLALVAAKQHGSTPILRPMLIWWFPTPVVDIAQTSLAAIAAGLARAGVLLPSRHWQSAGRPLRRICQPPLSAISGGRLRR